MYLIARTKDFEKSFKRVRRSGKLNKQAINNLEEAITLLASGRQLPKKYSDHRLIGELKQYRECHIKEDLLLVYQIRQTELLLVLVDIGSHSYLRI